MKINLIRRDTICYKITDIAVTSRAGPSYKQVKHLLETSQKFKNSLQKKVPNSRKKKKPTCSNLKEFWNKEKRKKRKKHC